MARRLKNQNNLVLVACFVVLFFGMLTVINDLTHNNVNIINETSNITQGNLQLQEDTINDFRLHWKYRNITYSFKTKCPEYEHDRVVRALNIIEKELNYTISFKEVYDSNIDFYCNNNSYSDPSSRIIISDEYRIAGLTSYSYLGTEILNATINFYNVNDRDWSSKCNYPNVEVHEILHSLGLNHSDLNSSIMNPSSEHCIERIDDDVKMKLIDIYKRDDNGGNE